VPFTIAFAPDGKTLATGGQDNLVHLWEVATGAERRVLRGHDSMVLSLSFSPDGRRLASSTSDSGDGTALIWDLAGPSTNMSADELNAAWQLLKINVAAKAYDAIRSMACDPEHSVPFLRQHLSPAVGADKGNPAVPEEIRGIRAVEVLEHIGNADARQVLEKLAAGAPEAWLTQEAKASLERLAK
jgi:WD40 repeat protein